MLLKRLSGIRWKPNSQGGPLGLGTYCRRPVAMIIGTHGANVHETAAMAWQSLGKPEARKLAEIVVRAFEKDRRNAYLTPAGDESSDSCGKGI